MDRREALRLIGTTAAIPVFAGLSPERLWAIAEGAHLRSASAAGRVLDAHQLETVATIAEHVLPRTGTPGARDAGIPAFIDLLLDEWYDEARSEEHTSELQSQSNLVCRLLLEKKKKKKKKKKQE